MEEEKIYRSHCGTIIDTDDYEELNGQILCSDCIDNLTLICDCCGERTWNKDTYGYENSPKAIMDKAKKNHGCYVAVNLCNYHTIEFRLFRGTLKYNTFIATLELVAKICDTAYTMIDDEISRL